MRWAEHLPPADALRGGACAAPLGAAVAASVRLGIKRGFGLLNCQVKFFHQLIINWG